MNYDYRTGFVRYPDADLGSPAAQALSESECRILPDLAEVDCPTGHT